MTKSDSSLTEDDKRAAFVEATTGFANAAERWKQRAATGLTDEQLADALRFEIGIYGGGSGPGRMATAHQGAGLKIWASWNGWINTATEQPEPHHGDLLVFEICVVIHISTIIRK